MQREVRARTLSLLTAIEQYRAHPYQRDLDDPPACWRAGSARLLDYGALVPDRGAGLPILVIPSLINRSCILDLTRRRSFMRWLADRGFSPYLIDWGAPDQTEAGFALSDYVTGYLEQALDAVMKASDRPPVVLGYCMGGMLALALAQRRQRELSGLALLATPWDFHAAGASRAQSSAAAVMALFMPLVNQLGYLPVDALQTLFAWVDPLAVTRKFIAFGRLDPGSRKAEDFVAVEDWVNDGVPLAAAVARECLIGWYIENTPASGQWRIDNRRVEPAEIDLPCFCAVPTDDNIVPAESATALSQKLKQVRRVQPRGGHIAMLVGQRAAEDLWLPLENWLTALPRE